MKASKTSSIAFTLLLVAAILVVLNYIVGGLGVLNFRADLTEKKQYTLSDGTKRIINNLNPDKPVNIRFYASRDSRILPQYVLAYARSVEDLLLEYAKSSGGKITLEIIDPRPDTEDEDRAVADDIQGHLVSQDGTKVYFGLAVQCLQKKEVIPVLDPVREVSLEYNISRALAKVARTKSTKIGVMSAMPITGSGSNLPPMLLQMQGQRQQPPWVVIQQLRQDYEVVEISTSADKIEPDVEILMVVHPADISNAAQFAIDQFLLKGGKVIAMVDPQCLVTQAYNNQGQMSNPPVIVSASSDMKKLFEAWGVKFSPSLVVADMNLRTQSQGVAQPTFLSMGGDSLSNEDPTVASLGVVQMFSAGAFDIEKKDGITVTPLVKSSENSQLIDAAEADKARSTAMTSFAGDGKRRAMIVRLNGTFQTAFPDGPPPNNMPIDGPKLPGDTGGATDDAGAPQADASTTAQAASSEPKVEYLKKSTAEGIVYLFSDVDMIYDMFCFAPADNRGSITNELINGNMPLVLNTVELLAGGQDLISVRSRAVTRRPFTRMEQLRDEVEAEYRPLIEQRNKELTDIVQQIASLGGTKQQDGVVVLNVNQEQREQLLEKQLTIQKDIRSLEKAQNSRKERLEMTITLLNFLIVPTLVVIFGVVFAIRRRSLQAAR